MLTLYIFQVTHCVNVFWKLQIFVVIMVLFCILEFLINIPVCSLIFDQFSHQYALIWTSTFIFYEQLMILYFCKWPIFIRNCIFEPIILYQYVYLEQYVYLFWQNFLPVLLFGPVRLLGTLEYTISEEKVESCRLCVESV